jgi:squalene-hopene/tetraprenyl-beta-curcumene cyclase
MTPLDRAAAGAIRYLEEERARGFAEAAHRMLFPRAAGFSGASEEQVGLVFPRAMIAEALLEAGEAGFSVSARGIAEDVEWLVARKCRHVPGGWRYFPDLPELPPDADDLAVILRLLVRTGHRRTRALCEDPLRLLLAQQDSSGAFGTWIVDPSDASEAAGVMRRAIAMHWGSSTDVEVIANLLYSLHLYDDSRFRTAIERGVAYVVTRQRPNGAWESTWYHSEYYGAFVCARLLAAVAPGHDALTRVAAMLQASQAGDGGWGRPASLPTDTALGVLTLAGLAERLPTMAPALDRAVAFLLARQAPEGQWPADDFIRMDTSRATPAPASEPRRILSYGSKTVTSALCLQALSAAHRCASVVTRRRAGKRPPAPDAASRLPEAFSQDFHGVLRARLHAAGLLLGDPTYTLLRRQAADLGGGLWSTLRAVIGERLWQRVQGALGRPLTDQECERVLGFGAMLTRFAVTPLAPSLPQATAIDALGALTNFTVGVYDTHVDAAPGRPLLDRSSLIRRLSGPGMRTARDWWLLVTSPPQARLFTVLVDEFLRRLAPLVGARPPARYRQDIAATIIAMYDAQHACHRLRLDVSARSLRDKGALPMVVMGAPAWLVTAQATELDIARHRRWLYRLGEFLALVDDSADLFADRLHGEPNRVARVLQRGARGLDAGAVAEAVASRGKRVLEYWYTSAASREPDSEARTLAMIVTSWLDGPR